MINSDQLLITTSPSSCIKYPEHCLSSGVYLHSESEAAVTLCSSSEHENTAIQHVCRTKQTDISSLGSQPAAECCCRVNTNKG